MTSLASLGKKGEMITQGEAETNLPAGVLRMIGWEHRSDKEKAKILDDTHTVLVHKINALLTSNERLKKRVEALHNTAIQSRRKADILQGQARSSENTARNIMNRLTEDEARLVAISRAALILNAVHHDNVS